MLNAGNDVVSSVHPCPGRTTAPKIAMKIAARDEDRVEVARSGVNKAAV